MRFFLVCLGLLIVLANNTFANSLVLNEIANLELKNTPIAAPNPKELQPLWWNYFDAEGEELQQRIQNTIYSLQGIYSSLSIEDQTVALPLINKIATTLNALPQAKQQENAQTDQERTFLATYTLENQIELHQHIRKLQHDIKNEKDRIAQLKTRLVKVQQHADNLMAAYFGMPASSSQKLLSGLEIIAYGANMGVAKHKVRLAEHSLEKNETKLKKLEEELAYSKQHMDASDFDEKRLEKNIAFFQKELDKKQNELATAEANLLVVFNDHYHDSHNNFLYEQQVLQAHVGRAHAWAQLSLQTLKYNLLMHLNERFQAEQHEFRDNLHSWREKIDTMSQQAQDWKRSALKEQDRLRQEYAFLIAQAEHADSKKLQFNQSMQKGAVYILTTVDLLEDELSMMDLLANLLEDNVRRNNSFLLNLWLSATGALSKTGHYIDNALHSSLFKVSGIPITPLMILKILAILSISFWLSRFIRSSLISFGKARGEITESTLYSLGSLAHYAVLLIGIIIALCTVGIDFGNLVFVLGALTFGISFGLQSLANNFFCGLRILFERKLHIGDSVELHSGQEGKVSEIHVQNTVVRTNDGQKVIVPNSELIGNTLVKWAKHQHDFRRLHIPFAVAAESDKELVRQVVIEAAKRVPCTLKHLPDYHEPQVWLINFSHHALEFELVVWIDYDADAITDSKDADFLWEIETALRQHNIALPPPPLHHLFPSMKAH